MPSLSARLVSFYTRHVIRLDRPRDPQALVRHLRRTMNNSPLLPLLPRGVRAIRFQHGQLHGDRLATESPRLHLLYLHGGGYVAGVTRTYHNLCGRLAKELQADAWLPDYRLGPEHPFPAAVDDAMTAYEGLLARGIAARDIVLGGDSAGGGLSLALLLRLRDEGKPLPRCALLMSPYADVTATAASLAGNDRTDTLLSNGMLTVGRYLYVQQEAQQRLPYASPVYGDYHGLPPLFITVSETECLRDDAYRVAEKARTAGVNVDLLARQSLMHVWPIFYPLLPEARADVTRMIRFVRGCR